jgi:signal peptidase I
MTRRTTILLGLVFVVAVGGALAARGLGVRPVKIVTGSMTPAVHTNDWIIVHDLHGDARNHLHQGDIVMFRYVGGDLRAIKRVVALAGERITIRRHSYSINGKTTPLAGAPGPNSARTRTETVPPGHVYVIGDNAAKSIDSRAVGPLPTHDILARSILVAGSTKHIVLTALALLAALAIGLALARFAIKHARGAGPARPLGELHAPASHRDVREGNPDLVRPDRRPPGQLDRLDATHRLRGSLLRALSRTVRAPQRLPRRLSNRRRPRTGHHLCRGASVIVSSSARSSPDPRPPAKRFSEQTSTSRRSSKANTTSMSLATTPDPTSFQLSVNERPMAPVVLKHGESTQPVDMTTEPAS